MNYINNKYKYRAFISYSHEDKRIASWLVRSLEKYKLPKNITTSKKQENNNYNLYPIFIDSEELNISSDLTGIVKEALKNSQFLIVICSPTAASSKWVNQEIREFINIHGIEKILCVIISGEPDKNHIDNCFPPALFDSGNSKYEPAAADLRPNKDGKQLVKLKLVASLLGIKLNQLIQREDKRRQKNAFNLSLITITIIVVMGYLAITANRARNLAIERLSQTEDLIEFMLTDLKVQLQPVGRLDVLSSVARKIVSQYETQSLEDMDDHSLGLYARSFHLLGRVERDLGNIDIAQEYFIVAMNSTKELYRRHPNNEQHIFTHAQSNFWMGSLSRSKGNYLEAEKYWRMYEILSEKLLKLNPNEIKWQMEVADAASNMGILFLEHLGLPIEAQNRFEKNLNIRLGLFSSMPKSTSSVYATADAYAWLADSLLRTGGISQARQHREDQSLIYENWLNTNPDDYFIKSRQLDAQSALAILSLNEGKVEEAKISFLHNINVAEGLVAYDPENMGWLKQAGAIYSTMLQIQYLEGDIEEQDKTILRLKEIEEILSENSMLYGVTQTIIVHRQQYISAKNHYLNGNYQLAKNELSQLLDAYENHDILTSQNITSEFIIKTQALLAQVEIKLGNIESARMLGSKLISILKPQINTLTPWNISNLAIAYYSAGNNSEAVRLVNLLFSSGYAHPELKYFCETELRTITNELVCSFN